AVAFAVAAAGAARCARRRMDPAAPVGATIEGMRSVFFAAVAAVLLLSAAPALAAERYAIIITGASGTAEHATQHGAWRDELAADLRGSMKMPPDHIHLLGDVAAERKAQRTVGDDVDVSSRERVRAAFARLAPVIDK